LTFTRILLSWVLRLFEAGEKFMDTTGKSLVEHWDWAATKGLMNKHTAAALRAASAQVLGVLDDWQNVDITTIDADDVVTRFKNLSAKKFTPQSLEKYEQRFKRALDLYLAYTRDPGAWRPASRRSRATKQAVSTEGSAKTENADPTTERAEPARTGLVDYPFPLRDGYTVRLMLPRDLKLSEVKRLTAFMTTLTTDAPPT
jgi:hypothetical protein